MISNVQCTPTENKKFYKFTLELQGGKKFEETFEESEIRHVITELDNAI